MKLVVFGLTVSSSWGNGHATLWRGLIRALGRYGWDVDFYERDTPYYADHRDLWAPEGGRLRLYSDWQDVSAEAAAAVRGADAAMVTSYCPDGRAACATIWSMDWRPCRRTGWRSCCSPSSGRNCSMLW
jgi:spore maturation protein CgeB